MSSTDGAPIRVLHVDDDRDFASVVAIHLERVDGDVEVATETSASDGLDRLAADDAVDCVVSDHDMPGMDGLEFLRAVRERDEDLPFILFTGKGSEEIASEAISAGVTEYLQKGTGDEQYAVLAHRIRRAVRQRRDQRALEESERMFSTLVGNLPGMVYRCDMGAGWPMQFVSEGCADLTGYEPDLVESGGVTWGEDVIHPDDRRPVREQIESAVAAGETFEVSYRIHTSGGELRWVRERGCGIYRDGEVAFLEGFVTDVTARRERTAELERSETVMDAVGDPVYALDAGGTFTFGNRAIESLTGYEPDEIVGEHVSTLVTEGDVERGREHIETLLAEPERRATKYEIDLLTKGGETIRCEVHIALLPPRDDGTFRGTAGIVRSIEARKRREQRLSEFASVVSHDLRNPLHVVQARAELAAETGDVGHVERVVAAAERMEAMIGDLLELARQGESVTGTRSVALEGVVREAWGTVETPDCELTVGDVGTVDADPERLRALVENLFRNAVEHCSTDTERAVSVRVGGTDGGFFVADDGPGIPAAERETVFERGYTTSEAGTGLGLAIVEQIARSHGWEVTVAEGDRGGARFEFVT